MDEASVNALYTAFVEEDPASAIELVDGARRSGVPQAQLFDVLFAPALALLATSWARDELDEAAFTKASVSAEQVFSFVTPPPENIGQGFPIVLACVKGETHSSGKNIVASTLKDAGYRVLDVGVDSSADEIITVVNESGALVVLVFAELMSSVDAVKRLKKAMDETGRKDVMLLVSGGPFGADTSLAKSAGANGIVKGAESALRLIGKVRERIASEGGA